jgi:hypothetical protein
MRRHEAQRAGFKTSPLRLCQGIASPISEPARVRRLALDACCLCPAERARKPNLPKAPSEPKSSGDDCLLPELP